MFGKFLLAWLSLVHTFGPATVNFTIVYTYVDGNDESVVKASKKHLGKVPVNRITDRNELKYSLRSVMKYMPWYKGPIVIVTNHKAPDWMDTSHPRIQIVTHKDIIDEQYLPTFNSAAIELNLHNIPGIGERIVYFNDDFFLGSSVKPSDFWSQDGKPNLRFNSQLGGSYAEYKKLHQDNKKLWRASVYYTNWKVSTLTDSNVHWFHKHTPYPMLTDVIAYIWEKFPEEANKTCTSKSRDYDDLRTTLMTTWLTHDLGLHNREFTSDSDGDNAYLFLKVTKLSKFVQKLAWIARRRPKFFNIAYFREEQVWEDAFLALMESLYHRPSEFEKP